MLTAAGVGSGLDIESVISQLMTLERRPLDRLEFAKTDVQIQLSANGQLRSAVGRLQSAAQALNDSDSLGGVSAASSNEDVLTVTAGADADLQSHDITVVRTATAHRLSSNAYTDQDTAIGTGTLDISIGSDTLSLTLDGSNNSLAQVRDAINASPDNPGVTASVITVDAGAQLVITANETGTANAITVTPGGGLVGFSTSQVGTLQDALIQVDGFDVTSASNEVTGAISGVTLQLLSAGTSSISFGSDSSVISDAVEELVNAFNGLKGTLGGLSQGALSGDSLLLSLERSVSQRFTSGVTLPDASEGFLYEAGVSFNDQGNLTFDASRLATSLAADPTRIIDLFGAEGAFADSLDAFLEGYLGDDGILDSRTESLEVRNDRLDGQIANLEFRLERTEIRLREQYTALDSLLARLTVTSDFLSQQLQSLPGASGRNG